MSRYRRAAEPGQVAPPLREWVAELRAWANRFGREPAARKAALLRECGRSTLSDPETLLAYHDCLLFLLAYTGYDYAKKTGAIFEQGRYLLPLDALYAGIVVAGLRGFGARFGPVIAGVLVVLAAGMGVWAQLLTIARFYG